MSRTPAPDDSEHVPQVTVAGLESVVPDAAAHAGCTPAHLLRLAPRAPTGGAA